MGERGSETGRSAAVFIALIVLLTLAVIYAPRFERRERGPRASVSTRPLMPAVSLWLSTEDRRLKLVRQPDIDMKPVGSSPADVVVDVQKTYQSMDGFGAAMTDSSAWLLTNKLNALQRRVLLHELYGQPPNLNLNMMRLTIGASDFSLKPYTLDDVPFGQVDTDLSHFNVTPNLADVIPVMQEVLSIRPGLLTIASPWSAPAWMKTSENLIGGELLEQYESTYADYLIKYLDAYQGYGIPIFALTLQNEPNFTPVTYPGMAMGPDTRARIVAQYLGPRLASRKQKTRILEWDHNWNHPEQPLSVLGDPDAARYIDGVAWHCYEGSQVAQGRVHRAFPQKDAYITECSGGDWASSANGELIWFSRNLLVTGIRHWARGVVYWNLALDENHGPHFGGCAACKGVITIDAQTGAVSRNDEYYALAHFSKFVLPGAVRVGSTDIDADSGVANAAFQNASDGSMVLVMVNSNTHERTVSVAQAPIRFEYTMPPRSVATFVWNTGQPGAWTRRVLSWLSGVVPAQNAIPAYRARPPQSTTPLQGAEPPEGTAPAPSSTVPPSPAPAASSTSPLSLAPAVSSTAAQGQAPAPGSISPLSAAPATSSTAAPNPAPAKGSTATPNPVPSPNSTVPPSPAPSPSSTVPPSPVPAQSAPPPQGSAPPQH